MDATSYLSTPPYLPPGYRFHPTDEELIGFYLSRKIENANFVVPVIGEADFNKEEPWDLAEKVHMVEVGQWYLYTIRDRKYSTGIRSNRATPSGYWKATGKDRIIQNNKNGCVIGLKKTLVFHMGRAPRGQKTNWVMHEYTKADQASLKLSVTNVYNNENECFFTTCDNSQDLKVNEWVLCRLMCKDVATNIKLMTKLEDGLHMTTNVNLTVNEQSHLTKMLNDTPSSLVNNTTQCSSSSYNHSNLFVNDDKTLEDLISEYAHPYKYQELPALRSSIYTPNVSSNNYAQYCDIQLKQHGSYSTIYQLYGSNTSIL